MNRIKDYEKLATDITAWIRDYATTNNIKSLVVGVSGGIDSAVVSTLCCRTGLRTYPCIIDIDSTQDSIAIADRHCQWLRDNWGNSISWHFKLGNTFKQYKNDIGSLQYDNHGMASAKSRLRMMVLYQKTYDDKGIVVGTGNKVEDFGIGFFTVGGDGCVSISPIADLYKTEVRELGRYLGISQEILDAKPTDGLWADGRTDEDQIGATYEELEWVMQHHVDGFTVESKMQNAVNIYNKLHMQNQHKMLPIPIYKLNQ